MPVSFYTGSITFANGIVPSGSTIDFTDTSQYGSASAIQSINQNGYTAGTVSGVGIDEGGNIVANYTNGIIKNIARFALADFPSLNGLARIGSTLYQTSPKSGDPLYNKPGEGRCRIYLFLDARRIERGHRGRVYQDDYHSKRVSGQFEGDLDHRRDAGPIDEYPVVSGR